MSKEKYYSLTNIITHNADYNMIYNWRSYGKINALLKYGLKYDYINHYTVIKICEALIDGGW